MFESIRSRVRRLIHEERAVALTEFALVAPLLFVILFGTIDFGKAINYWIDETHLANEAARFAAVNRNPGTASGLTLQQWIQAQADTSELRNGNTASILTGNQAKVCILFPNTTSNVGDPVRVTVRAKYNWMPFLNLSVTQVSINGTSTMQLEAAPTNYTADPPSCPS
jgi:Flp pilus assembly protein TadG